MKITRYATVLLMAGLFSACNNDDNPAPAPANNGTLSVNGNNATVTGNLANLRLKNVSGTVHLDPSTTQGQLRIQSPSALNSNMMAVTTQNGELRVEGNNNLPANLQLHFYLHPNDLQRIVIEGNNIVTIASSAVLDNLELVTEGESQLTFTGLQARNLVSRREGKSKMTLSSELPFLANDTVAYLASAVTVLGTQHLLYTHNNQHYVLQAGSITTSADSVYAVPVDVSNPLRVFFVSQTHNLRNEGETELHALWLPTLAVTSKNEGNSESNVWPINNLTVKGEGESVMKYKGNPAISQNMSGSSSLVHLP